jgi:hypothetical protein
MSRGLRVTCDKQRAIPRSARNASRRTRRMSKRSSGSSFGVSQGGRLKCSSASHWHHLLNTFWAGATSNLPDGESDHSGYCVLNVPLTAPTPTGAERPCADTGHRYRTATLAEDPAACGVGAAATYRPRPGRRVCIDSIRTLSVQLECSALHCIGGRKPLAYPSVLLEIRVRPPEHLMVLKQDRARRIGSRSDFFASRLCRRRRGKLSTSWTAQCLATPSYVLKTPPHQPLRSPADNPLTPCVHAFRNLGQRDTAHPDRW